MRDTQGPLPETAFWTAFQAKFYGVPSWTAFDKFWPVLEASGGDWFVFDPGGDAPEAPEADMAAIFDEARACVEAVREMRSFCGTVFTDNMEAPTFVKVFDPWKMGGVCGGSGERVMPRWVFSRIAPDALPLVPEQPQKTGLMARLRG